MSDDSLARDLSLSRQQVRSALKRLKSTNDITIHSTNKGKVITLCNFDAYNSEDEKINQPNNQQHNQRVTNDQPTINQQVTTPKEGNKDNKGNKVRKENPQTPKGADDGFEQFWKSYPKKIGKGAAEKAWQKTKPELNAILGALTWQTRSEAWTKDGGQYIPNPATYINQRRWEDEPTCNVNGSHLPPGERPPENWRNVYLEALSDEERLNCGGVAPDWKTLPEWAKKRIREEIEEKSNFVLTASIP
ncbi:MAG: hypothetical protein ACO3RQ_09320 [Litorivicinaceae bacterium]